MSFLHLLVLFWAFLYHKISPHTKQNSLFHHSRRSITLLAWRCSSAHGNGKFTLRIGFLTKLRSIFLSSVKINTVRGVFLTLAITYCVLKHKQTKVPKQVRIKTTTGTITIATTIITTMTIATTIAAVPPGNNEVGSIRSCCCCIIWRLIDVDQCDVLNLQAVCLD